MNEEVTEELKAASELYELGFKLRLNSISWRALLHDFITTKKLNRELLAYAKTRAEDFRDPHHHSPA